MARFISISGPSSTGKTSLINSLSTYPELHTAVFSPDFYETVWKDLVDKGYFSSWKEINTDSEYLCVYIMRLLDYYENYLDSYESSDRLVILDGSWIDISIYAILNLWYSRIIQEVQESIFARINKFDNRIARIYITKFDESKHTEIPYHIPYRIANMKVNRPLELQYYDLFSNMNYVRRLPSTDTSDMSLFIIEDLRNLGYV